MTDTPPASADVRWNRGRRAFLSGTAALAGAEWLAGPTRAQVLRTRLILIDTRVANEGRVPLAPLVRVHELSKGEQMWIDGARAHFRGNVVLGRDLLEI